MKYRKKPVQIEAVQFINGKVDEKPDWILDAFGELTIYVDSLNRWFISTLEGDMRVLNGDYIIRGVKGEIYSCRQDIFEQTYEKVKGGEQDDSKRFEEMFPSLAHAEAFTVGGRRFVAMDSVLEIIDSYESSANESFTGEFQRGNLTALYGLRQRVSELRGEQDAKN